MVIMARTGRKIFFRNLKVQHCPELDASTTAPRLTFLSPCSRWSGFSTAEIVAFWGTGIANLGDVRELISQRLDRTLETSQNWTRQILRQKLEASPFNHLLLQTGCALDFFELPVPNWATIYENEVNFILHSIQKFDCEKINRKRPQSQITSFISKFQKA